jgi:hypothetical protein
MLDNNLNSPSGAAEDGRNRPRQSAEARPLTDREVPLGRPGMSAEVHAWLDGELPESSVRKAELSRDVELWSRVNAETARRRQLKTPAHLQASIMAALPQVAPQPVTPWFEREIVVTPMTAIASVVGIAAVAATITAIVVNNGR